VGLEAPGAALQRLEALEEAGRAEPLLEGVVVASHVEPSAPPSRVARGHPAGAPGGDHADVAGPGAAQEGPADPPQPHEAGGVRTEQPELVEQGEHLGPVLLAVRIVLDQLVEPGVGGEDRPALCPGPEVERLRPLEQVLHVERSEPHPEPASR